MATTTDTTTDLSLLDFPAAPPPCDNCHQERPLRWLAVKVCPCGDEWLICDHCRLENQLGEAQTLLHGGTFHCTECGATAAHMVDLVHITPI